MRYGWAVHECFVLACMHARHDYCQTVSTALELVSMFFLFITLFLDPSFLDKPPNLKKCDTQTQTEIQKMSWKY